MRLPKIPHLPWSPGVTEEDIIAESEVIEYLNGEEVVVFEKMEGESIRMTANSLSGRHVSRQGSPIWRRWLKGFWESKKENLESEVIIYGENMWAAHSIHYRMLASYFLAFLVVSGNDRDALSWDETEKYLDALGISSAPIVYRGIYNKKLIEERYAQYCKTLNRESEGYVIRIVDTFSMDDFGISVFKWVKTGYQKVINWERGPYYRNKMQGEIEDGSERDI